MKSDDLDSLAAEYVLGTLDGEARAEVRARMQDDPALCRSVEAWEARLSGLSAEETPLEPPAGLWDRVAADLEAAPQETRGQAPDPAGFAITVRAEEGEWRKILPGVHRKHLFIDRKAGYQAFLLKFEPGARLPAHPHSATEECVMLEGEAWAGELYLKAGDYHVISGGMTHPEIRSDSGAVVYVRGEIRTAA